MTVKFETDNPGYTGEKVFLDNSVVENLRIQTEDLPRAIDSTRFRTGKDSSSGKYYIEATASVYPHKLVLIDKEKRTDPATSHTIWYRDFQQKGLSCVIYDKNDEYKGKLLPVAVKN